MALNSILIFPQNDTVQAGYAFPSVGIRFHKGFIIPHSESIKSISYSKPWILETDFSLHYTSDKAFNYCNCYPRLGVSVMYINFDNRSILGNGFAIVPFVEPFFSAYRKISTSFRFAVGAVYLNNVYHPETNPMNLFYSTPFSFLLSLNFSVNYRMSSHWNSRLTINYNHISNGGNREPNKGINFPTLSLGFDYLVKPTLFKKNEKINQPLSSKKSSLKVALLLTSRKPFPNEKTRYWVFGIASNWSYLFGRISALTVGAEWVNDLSLRESLERTGGNVPDHNRAGFLVGHELQIGRFRFSQQLGIYVYTPAKPRDPVYQRWGLDFLINRRLFTGVNLKTHRHIADFMDFRVGYLIN
jgi:hypothetical protein